MTSGSIIFDRSPQSKYYKTWDGTNYPATPASNLFQASWKKIDLAIEEAERTKVRNRLGYSYGRIWEKRRVKPRTSLVDHPYDMLLEFWMDSQGIWNVYDFYPPYQLVGTSVYWFRQLYSSGYSSNFSTAWNANDTIALQGKLREKIIGSDFDMGVFLGEGREALSLIANSAKRIYDAYRSFRRLDVKGVSVALGASHRDVERAFKRSRMPLSPTAASRQAAQAWLELQYGWMPLLKDAEGAAQALAQQLNEPAVQTYRVRMKKPITATPLSSNIKTFDFDGLARGQLIGRVKEVNVPALNGLIDPSSVLWELTPWSFVADWFIPIGSYLSARGLAQSVSGTFVTTISKRESFFAQSGVPTGSPQNELVREFNYRHLKVQVQRTVSSSLNTPFPQFKPLKDVVSWKHAANAVALLVTNFSGGKVADKRKLLPSHKGNR
jgi:hypothetical protein